MSEKQTVTILVVDDDHIDQRAIERAFKQKKIANPLVFATDGVDGLELLRGTNGKEKLARPYMIFLDLNMPRMNGIEFLEELRTDPDLHSSIVFVLTTSDDDRDKFAAYDRHVAGYIVKTNVGANFFELLDMLDYYWRVVEIPPSDHESR